jgi:hypothetical protein
MERFRQRREVDFTRMHVNDSFQKGALRKSCIPSAASAYAKFKSHDIYFIIRDVM